MVETCHDIPGHHRHSLFETRMPGRGQHSGYSFLYITPCLIEIATGAACWIRDSRAFQLYLPLVMFALDEQSKTIVLCVLPNCFDHVPFFIGERLIGFFDHGFSLFWGMDNPSAIRLRTIAALRHLASVFGMPSR